MKLKKVIAIATAAAFALTGTCYADTGDNLAAEGSDVTEVIEDISLMGERIEADDTSYYTGDVTVNFSLYDETGISSVAVLVNGEKLAEKKYDTSDCIETADGEVMNADSTVETEGADAQANTSEPVTAVSDALIISAEDLKALSEPEAEATEPETEAEATEPETEAEATEPETEAEATEPEAEAEVAEPEAEADATEPEAEAEATEPEAEAEAIEPESDIVADSEYSAEMVITDVNGNIERKAFAFNAVIAETPAEEQEAVEELQAATLGNVQVIDETTFRVEVNLTCQTVTFYQKNLEGGYDPIRFGVCSTARSGYSTPTGTFKIGPSNGKCGRSRWALLSSGKSFAQYLVRFKGAKCFHSVIYKTRGDNSSMYRGEYNKLGKTASAGCVRMRAIDAKWLYDHCPDGTVVKVYKDSVASPLGVPTYDKLPSGSTLTWDPTDPDTGNPYLGGSGTATGLYFAWEDGLPVLMLSSDLASHVVNLSTTKYTYNGKARKPSVTIYGLKKGTNFKVTYPEGRTNVGSYTVQVEGIGSFTGCNSATFQIVPKSTKINSLKRAGKKKFKVKYKKITKQISGYEIKYSTSSKFKNSKTAKANSYKKTSKTIKVPSKGTYYVKVRVYKTVDGVTYYSNWSSKKRVKVK